MEESPSVEIDVSETMTLSPTDADYETSFEDEINVYSIPHSRMRRLAQMAVDKLKSTNCSNACDLLTTVKTLSRVFYEFKTHERIENECIMRRLQAKLNKLNIQNTAVCNCHKDDELSKMLKLFSEGIRYSTKSESERISYGLKLQRELEKFQEHFLPHMQEEEDIFQPLLVEYFSVEELKELKESVLKQHQMWNNMDNLEDLVNQYDDNPWTTSNRTNSSTTTSIKTWSGTSSSSFHLTSLFDEKTSPDIVSLYIESLDDASNPGCGYVKSQSVIEEKILLDSLYGKTTGSLNGSAPHFSSNSRLHSPAKTTSQGNVPFISMLPSEILARVFTYLTISDLCRVSQVCRQWNAVALDAHLWLTLAPLVWLESLKDERKRDVSWQNIETESLASTAMTDAEGDRLVPLLSEDSDSTASRVEIQSLGGSSLVSEPGFRREQSAIASITYHLAPRIGTRVSKLSLAGSRSLTNVLLRKLLHYIPNVTHLDVRDTRIGDAAFKSLNRHRGVGDAGDVDDVGPCLGRLRFLNLSGCVNFTDEGLRRLLATMDGALTRISAEAESGLSLLSQDDRLTNRDCESIRSSVSGRVDLGSAVCKPSIDDTEFQGLVIGEDQMRAMRERALMLRRRNSISGERRGKTVMAKEDSPCGSCDYSSVCPVGKRVTLIAEGPALALDAKGDSALPSRPLEFVSLSGCYQITDEGLTILSTGTHDNAVRPGFPNLRHLDLSGCMNVSVEGILPLLDSCPLINLAKFFYCDNLSLGDEIDDLSSGCRNLQRGSRACCRLGI